MKFSVFLLLCFSCLANAAGPTVTSVTGVTSAVLTGNITLFGGMAGDACTGSDSNTPCDSCASTSCTTAPLCACNPARVYNDLIVTIRLQLPANVVGQARAKFTRSGGTATALTPVTTTNGGTFFDFRWKSLCTSNDCEAESTISFSITLYIDVNNDGEQATTGEEGTVVTVKLIKPTSNTYDVYASPTSQGIGSFLPYPGDEKIFIEDIASPSGFPTLGYTATATKVIVYISQTNIDNAYQNGGPALTPQVLNLVDNGTTLADNDVSGLENDVLHFFRIALKDEADNIVQYFPGVLTSASNCTGTTANSSCAYSATPSEVLGLLNKDVNCFVATAAYGSSLEPKLDVFRQIRHRYLLTNPLGVQAVRWYYKYGPMAARWIYDKPWVRFAARAALWPIYGVSWLVLKFGLLWVSLLATAVLGLSALTLRKVSRGRRRASAESRAH